MGALKKTYKTALSGILLALACGISWIEQVIPLPLPLGAKLGLSSVIIMFSIVKLDFKTSMSIVILKSVFILAVRAVTAFFMSISGGILSFIVMLLLYRSKKASIIMISVCGAVSHNIGQLICACIIMKSAGLLTYYAPVLILTGCITGIFTGIISENVLKHTKNSIIMEVRNEETKKHQSSTLQKH